MTLLVTGLSGSRLEAPEERLGNETVAAFWPWASKADLLAESTTVGPAVEPRLRPMRLLILSCHDSCVPNWIGGWARGAAAAAAAKDIGAAGLGGPIGAGVATGATGCLPEAGLAGGRRTTGFVGGSDTCGCAASPSYAGCPSIVGGGGVGDLDLACV